MLSKLAPKMIMRRMAEIIVENAQYLVGLDHVTITEISDDYETLEIKKCPVVKQFKKTIKALNFDDLEKRYVCTFACVPVLNQMCGVGNLYLTADYTEDGCQLLVKMKPKGSEELPQTEKDTGVPLKNGPTR